MKFAVSARIIDPVYSHPIRVKSFYHTGIDESDLIAVLKDENLPIQKGGGKKLGIGYEQMRRRMHDGPPK